MKIKTHIYINFILFFIIIAFLLVSEIIRPSDNIYCLFISTIFIVSFISRSINTEEGLYTLYSLYMYTFYIFILGSFFSGLILDYPIFQRDIFGMISVENKTKLIFYIFTFYFFCELGYFYKNNNKNFNEVLFSDKIVKNFVLFVTVIFFTTEVFLIQINIDNIFKSINNSYLSLYESGNNGVAQTPTELLLFMVNNVSLGMAFIISKYKPKLFKIVLAVFILNSCLSILGGARSAAISSIFIFLYIFNMKNNRFSFKNMAILFCISIFILELLNYVMTFTSRSAYEKVSLVSYIGKFLYDQGSTLLVFNSSMQIDSYPIIAYIKTFIPVIHNIISSLSIETLHPYDINFSHYLSWKIDSSLYFTGRGLGWSLLSDIYIYSFGNIILFSGLSFLFGFFIRYISYGSVYSQGLALSIAPVLFTINRGSISTMIPIIILYYIILYILNRRFL
ncbi:TPA: O-antigen polysaccharide polymerase Wzy [Photobacterium damselae]